MKSGGSDSEFEMNNNNNSTEKGKGIFAPLCEEFIRNDGKCTSKRPSGGWCCNGYHLSVHYESHYRNTGKLPMLEMFRNFFFCVFLVFVFFFFCFSLFLLAWIFRNF